MKKSALCLLVVAFITGASGCGGERQPENTIVMWHVGAESQARTIMEISRAFTEKTGVKVVCQAISWSDAHSKYLISIAGELTPDIGSMGLTWGMEFGELGALIDMREHFPEDVKNLENKIFPGILESTRAGEKVFGIPFDFSEHVMYYRSDIIPSAPDNWEDFLNMISNLKREGKGALMDWGSLDWIGYAPFLWQAGGDFYDGTKTKVTLDTPQAAKALGYMASLYKNGVPVTQIP
ncbi:MAG TPA: extracellular solute-binding protein, partial [Candidatus Omnitrophota bacterium]|nr:extracellular solute-binding protein [Candidatus Omnitrophota bacterium]